MSVNTSDEYLDELLQAIEPIIHINEPEPIREPVAPPVVEPVVEIADETMAVPEETETENMLTSEEISDFTPDIRSDFVTEPTEMEVQDSDSDSAVLENGGEEVDLSEFLSMDDSAEEYENSADMDMSSEIESMDETSAAIGDLLASLAAEADADAADETGMSEEDIESMLNAVSSQPVEETVTDNQDVKDLLKQFTEDEDLSDIQDILDKNDNGEALDNSMLDLPEVEVFKLEEDAEDEEDDSVEKKGFVGKLFSGISGFFKNRKKKKTSEESAEETENTDAEVQEFEELSTEQELGFEELDEASLFDVMSGDDAEEILLDEDMSDIEMLLSGGALQGTDTVAENTQVSKEAEESNKGKKKKKDKKEKKESIFTKVLNLLTEEVDEPSGKRDGSIPEAEETVITDENLNILEDLSKEDKKKAKKEAKKDKKKNGKKASKDGDGDDAEGKGAKGKKDKKPKKEKKKREKKVKEPKPKVIAKPEKKLPKKRVLSTLALCFSILAAVLILENVVTKTDNNKEAVYAYDTGDYATCFANLSMVEERSEEEEALYQKSFIILTVQRKLDAYNNFIQMNREVEAVNSLFEGVIVYREQEETALEWGVQGQTHAIYENILDKLSDYGLSDRDIDEILNYESKVTYTKRLDSIVNGTPFVVEDTIEDFIESQPQPLLDVLPGEEDFLPEDTTQVTSGLQEEAISEASEVVSEEQTGQTVVVGSNPVDIFSSDTIDVGGENVGSGSTDVSIEVDDGNAVVNGM